MVHRYIYESQKKWIGFSHFKDMCDKILFMCPLVRSSMGCPNSLVCFVRFSKTKPQVGGGKR